MFFENFYVLITIITLCGIGEVLLKKRKRLDLSAQSLERNFITPVRAMSDFLLKPSDLESLPKTKRRSPYEFEPPITVYWRKDVENKALEIWGSLENLQRERLKREIERRKYQQSKYIQTCLNLQTILYNFRYIHCEKEIEGL